MIKNKLVPLICEKEEKAVSISEFSHLTIYGQQKFEETNIQG